jgi:5-methylcytosine-specific restriction enzyme subunit McrC
MHRSETVLQGADHYVASKHVPIRNIWLLMLWASDLFKSKVLEDYGYEDLPDDLPDLIAEVLLSAVEHRLRRWLTKGYRQRTEVLGRVRGRIDYLATERRLLLQRGRIQCTFEEQTVDLPRNRLARLALQTIARLVSSNDIARRCRECAGQLAVAGVSAVRPSAAEVAKEQLIHDKPMIDAALLALEMALPAPEGNARSYTKVDRQEYWVRRLFEKAVGGFYKVALPRKLWSVSTGTKLSWNETGRSAGLASLMPEMVTDIVLESGTRTVVIDTKFTSLLTSSQFKREVLKSGYIYQMYAYLRTQEAGDNHRQIRREGILLHPSVGQDFSEYIVLQGYPVRFETVDLTSSASAIRSRLLALVEAR